MPAPPPALPGPSASSHCGPRGPAPPRPSAPTLPSPGGLRELPVDLLIHVHVEGPLHKGQGHLQGLCPQRGAVISNELQPFDAHKAAVAGRVLLQILGRVCGVDGGCERWNPEAKPRQERQGRNPNADPPPVSERPHAYVGLRQTTSQF